MSTTNVTPEVIPDITPDATPAAPAAPVAQPEQRYEYQPTDEQGRPLGGKQVILYRTPDELATKLAEQNTLLIRRLRTVTKEHRLGIKPNETIPADAERFDELVEFKPRELTAEERFQISQDLNDPEKFVDARDRLLESAVGADPAKLTKVLNEQQLYILQLKAGENYVAFAKSAQNQGYADSIENRDIITNWMLKNKLAPTVKNFSLAYSTLREAGLLIEAPVVQQEPTPTPTPTKVEPTPVDTTANPQPSVAEPSRIAGQPQPQAKRQGHVPSGLNDRVSSTTGASSEPAGDGLSLTLAQIEALPADKYKAYLKNPQFVKHVNALEAAAAQRRAERAQQS